MADFGVDGDAPAPSFVGAAPSGAMAGDSVMALRVQTDKMQAELATTRSQISEILKLVE